MSGGSAGLLLYVRLDLSRLFSLVQVFISCVVSKTDCAIARILDYYVVLRSPMHTILSRQAFPKLRPLYKMFTNWIGGYTARAMSLFVFGDLSTVICRVRDGSPAVVTPRGAQGARS